MYARGGPSVGSHTAVDPAAMVSRRRSSLGGSEGSAQPGNPASVGSQGAWRRRSGAAGTPQASGSLGGARRASVASASSAGRPPRFSMGEALSPDVQSQDRLKTAFCAFASFGQGSSPAPAKARAAEMDSKQFVKLCRESGVIDARLSSTAADLAFIAKAQPLGARKIGFQQFKAAVEQLAYEKGAPQEELFAQIAACPGPRTTRAGTPAPIVRRSAAAPVNSPAFDASLPAATEAVGQETAGADTITVPMNKLSLGGKVISITATAM